MWTLYGMGMKNKKGYLAASVARPRFVGDPAARGWRYGGVCEMQRGLLSVWDMIFKYCAGRVEMG